MGRVDHARDPQAGTPLLQAAGRLPARLARAAQHEDRRAATARLAAERPDRIGAGHPRRQRRARDAAGGYERHPVRRRQIRGLKEAPQAALLAELAQVLEVGRDHPASPSLLQRLPDRVDDLVLRDPVDLHSHQRHTFPNVHRHLPMQRPPRARARSARRWIGLSWLTRFPREALQGARRRARGRTPSRPCAGRASIAAQLRTGRKALQRIGEPVGPPGRDEQPAGAVVHHLGHPHHAGAHHRQLRGHRLHQHHAETLGQRGQTKGVGRRVQARQLVLPDGPDEVDAVGERELAGERLEAGPLGRRRRRSHRAQAPASAGSQAPRSGGRVPCPERGERR